MTGLVLEDGLTSSQVTDRLDKIRWRQDFARRGLERKEDVSPELAEALRNEIRTALDAGGNPFDVNVARRVYDLAIAARDMCIAASNSVKEAIDQVKETNGPMESLQGPGAPDALATPESQAQAAETYGARVLRELLAMTTDLRKPREDPHVLIAAIADARSRGMHDLAAALEEKLVGTPLEVPKITRAEVVANSYEHGFVDGSMQDNFERCTIDGHVGVDRKDWSPAYREGFEAGRARRLKTLPSPPPGYEHTVVDQTPCARCGDFKGDHHGRCVVVKNGHACTCEGFVAAGSSMPVLIGDDPDVVAATAHFRSTPAGTMLDPG
jgi:hypothetical protein